MKVRVLLSFANLLTCFFFVGAISVTAQSKPVVADFVEYLPEPDLVRLHISIIDRKTRHVLSDVDYRDLEIFEDNHRVDIAYFMKPDAERSSSYYVVEFLPKYVSENRWHKIKIRPKRNINRKMDIIAPGHYYY